MADASVVFTTDLDPAGIKSGLSRLKSSIGTYAKGALIALGAVGAGLGLIAKQALSYNSQMEQYMTSFTVLLGSEAKASQKMAELKEYAAATPFEMTDLANATKTILGFGVAEDKASVAMKQLGDISMGNKERFSALSLVYGQMASTGKLMGQDLLQMINAGFNPLTIIADKTGASVADLKHVMAGEKTSDDFKKMIVAAQKEVKTLGADASDSAKMLAEIGNSGQISAALVDEAMQIATSKGGLFYQAMEKQSKTAAGLISTLKDNANVLLGEAFSGVSETMKSTAIPTALAYVQTLADALRAGGPAGMMEAFGGVMGDVAGKAATFAPQFIRLAVSILKAFLSGIKANSKVISRGLMEAVLAAILGLVALAPDLVDVGLELLLGLGDGLADALPTILIALVNAAFNIIVKLLSNVPRLLATGAKIAQAIVFGMMQGLVALLGDFWALLFGDTEQKMKDALDSVTVAIRPQLSDEDKQAMTAAINSGIEAAQKVVSIKAEVDADIEKFSAELDAAFADDKFTKKELKGLKSTLNAQVDDAIKAATEHVEQKREEYKQTLLTLVDDKGQPLFTEAAAETMAATMTAKTAELTAELDTARNDLNNLLNTIYASKLDPTQEQLDNINALLEQIGILGVKLGSVQDQAVQVAEAKTGRVLRGEGTDEDYYQAIGYTGEIYRQKTIDMEKNANERLAVLQSAAEAEGATQDIITSSYAQMQQVYDQRDVEAKAASDAYTADVVALYNAQAAANPAAAAAVQTLTDTMQKYTELQNIVPADLSAGSDTLLQQISDYLATNTDLMNPPTAAQLRAGGLDSYTQLFVGEAIDAMNEAMPGEIDAAQKGLGENNPLMLYLQAMLENGDFEKLDITKLDGALKNALTLIDLKARGSDAGKQLVEGVDAGIGYGADNLSQDNIIALREAMLEELRTVFGIHSPATSMYPMGEMIVEGVVQGMTLASDKAERGGWAMVDAISAGMTKNRQAVAAAVQAVLASAASHGTAIAGVLGFAVGAALGAAVVAGILSQAGAAAAAIASLVAVAGTAGSGSSGLVDRVRSITGSPPLTGKGGGASGFLGGSVLGAKGGNVTNNTVNYTQQVTFGSTMQAPDEIARAMRKQAAYGLAGVKL